LKVLASLVVGCLLVTSAFASDSPAPSASLSTLPAVSSSASPQRMQAAMELLTVMGAQRASEAGIQATLDNLIASRPMMAPYRSVFMAWAARYVSWQQLEPRIALLYANAFTRSELEDLIHFYQTPTGRKAAQVMPDLAKQAMLVGSSLAREHTPELQQMIRERAAQLQQQGAAPGSPQASPGSPQGSPPQ
jgi:hypothetical protein